MFRRQSWKESGGSEGKGADPKLYSEETSQTGTVGLKVYWYFLSKLGIFSTCFVLVLLVLSQILSTGSFVWLSVWSVAQNNTDVYYYLGTYAGLGILNASCKMHESLLECILKNSMSFFDKTPLGRILNRFGQDIEVLDTKMSICIFGSITGTLSYLATVTIISINPILLSSAETTRLSGYIPHLLHFGETLAGINTIRAYSLEKCFYSEFERRLDEWLAIRINLIGNILIFASALFSVLARDTITS
ncbi:ATP-binding cassette sub-family C member 1, partial [Caligus rogercresseyi]